MNQIERLCFTCPLDDCQPHSIRCPILVARAQAKEARVRAHPPTLRLVTAAPPPPSPTDAQLARLMAALDAVLDPPRPRRQSPSRLRWHSPHPKRTPGIPPEAAPFVEPVYRAILGGAWRREDIKRRVAVDGPTLEMVLMYLVPERVKTRDTGEGVIFFPPRHVRRQQAKRFGRQDDSQGKRLALVRERKCG